MTAEDYPPVEGACQPSTRSSAVHGEESTEAISILTSQESCNDETDSWREIHQHFMRARTLAILCLDVLIAARRTPVARDRMETHLLALVPCAADVLTCAVTIICAFREVFVYEFDIFSAGKGVPVLRS